MARPLLGADEIGSAQTQAGDRRLESKELARLSSVAVIDNDIRQQQPIGERAGDDPPRDGKRRSPMARGAQRLDRGGKRG